MREQYLLQKQNLLLRQALFLASLFPRAISYIAVNNYCLDLNIKKKYLRELLHILRFQLLLRYQTVSEITAIDFPQKPYRFRIVYSMLCYDYTSRLILSCNTSEKGVISSAIATFPGAGWLEREVWDLFGVFFRGNNDLRRIMTDYGFVGHPLRKDFPLTGFYEVQYDDRKKQVIYRPVSLAQEFRNFRAVNVWQQLN